MSTIASRTFTQAFNESRSHLNDAGGDVCTDAVLLPFGARAHRKIQRTFASHGIPVVETVVSNLSYTANASTITLSSLTDLKEPLEIWEKGTDDETWSLMERDGAVGPPSTEAGVIIGVWEWLNGAVRVPPCSTNRDIFLRYRRGLAYPAAVDPVGFDDFYDPIISGTAYYCGVALQRGNPQVLLSEFQSDLEEAVHPASRDRQGIVYRQQGWNSRSRRPITISQD